MAVDFPNSPTVGQIYNSNGITRRWDGTTWSIVPVTLQGVTGATGLQGLQGPSGITTATTPLTYDTPTKTIALTTVPITLGGTGQITASAALNALLPSQTVNTNKFLQTNGSTTLWADVAAANITGNTLASGITASSLTSFGTSPALTGTPTSTTAAVDTNTTQIATTAYVVGQAYAKIASPTFTGTPTLPTGTIATTQTAGNSTTAVATTAFVTTADNLKANIASPSFTGTPLSITAAVDTNTTQIATTAYVVGQGYLKSATAASTYLPLTGGTISSDLIVSGNFTVNGTITTINATTLTVDDINIELGSVTVPSDATAAGGGITLKGAADKSILWQSTATTANTANTGYWNLTDNLNLNGSTKAYYINGTSVLSGTTLGSGVTASSLTSVGTLASLTVTNPITGSVTGNAGTVTNGVYTNIANTFTASNTFNTNATSFVKQAATVAPTVDMFQITNAGFPIVTAGISALQVNYVGGAAAVESSASRVDITTGTTSGGTWNGFRVVPIQATSTGVTYNGIKLDNLSVGAGTDNAIYVGTGYDNIINYNGTSLLTATALGTGILSSSLTSVGTLTNLTVTNAISGSVTGNAGTVTNGVYTNISNTITGSLTAQSFIPSAATVPTNGMYLPTTNTLSLATNTTERFRIDANGSIKLFAQILEATTVAATAAATTVTYDVITNKNVLYYTGAATANWTFNVRGSATVSLNTLMDVGQSLTVVFLNTNTATAFYPTAFQIDTVAVAPKWQGGTAPTSGNINSVDSYSYTIIKTDATPTYTVLASQSRFT